MVVRALFLLALLIPTLAIADLTQILNDCDKKIPRAALPKEVPELIDGACPLSKNQKKGRRLISQEYEVPNTSIGELLSDYREGLEFSGWQDIQMGTRDKPVNALSARHASGLYLELVPRPSKTLFFEGNRPANLLQVFNEKTKLKFLLNVYEE